MILRVRRNFFEITTKPNKPPVPVASVHPEAPDNLLEALRGASIVDLQGYVDHSLPLSLLCITMILHVRRKFFEITTKPNTYVITILY